MQVDNPDDYVDGYVNDHDDYYDGYYGDYGDYSGYGYFAYAPSPVAVGSSSALESNRVSGGAAVAFSIASSTVVSAAEAPVRIQADFSTTPLFMTINSTTNGTGAVTFTAPDNLGTFVIRIYGATGEHHILIFIF